MSAHPILPSRRSVTAGCLALILALTTGGCMNDSNNPDDRGQVADHVETDHYELDLTEPPTRADVGISDGRQGLSVYFKDDTSRTFRTDLALPGGLTLTLHPRLVVVDATDNLERPPELTPETAPPGHVGLQFSFDTTAQAEAFMRDLAAQLGPDHRGEITDRYITETLGHLRRGTRPPSPRIAETRIGYLLLSVQPRIGTAPEQGPHFLVDFHWTRMPTADSTG
ncbi:hypothetical protein CLV30_105268 [Haloactinopolyspora alba]|uniref:Uncharacterized protein n=1 Tax=Haloactinopolyspora alba TaxID=648780 RepID=A0A2P8E5R6_9ACTN|nr:hypothetical protein [Haloactinopolyspora alba]PSL04801.1 hypothetical protein CLV30_105268 [Haloactinopolyspora alba]